MPEPATILSPVLIVDDGELGDVHSLLSELEPETVRRRGSSLPDDLPAPARLFVTTPRHAQLAKSFRATPGLECICVVEGDSTALRGQLRKLGFDLLVRRPIHPFALRLALARALYTGEERRGQERVVVGRQVDVRSGTRVDSALLADVSERGCRLLTETPLPVGQRVSIQLTPELTGAESMVLGAKVLRRASTSTDRRHDVALSVEPSDPDSFTAVLRALRGLPALAQSRTPAADRRKDTRVEFSGEVHAVGHEAERMLLGRDLSMGGMRVDPLEGLTEGTGVQLALYASPDEDPIVVWARVARDDGADGLGLRFEDVAPAEASKIERLVARLPSVESLKRGEAAGLGSVVSEILEREAPES